MNKTSQLYGVVDVGAKRCKRTIYAQMLCVDYVRLNRRVKSKCGYLKMRINTHSNF